MAPNIACNSDRVPVYTNKYFQVVDNDGVGELETFTWAYG